MENGIGVPLIVVTLFWAIVGGGLPWVVPKGPNRGKTSIIKQNIIFFIFLLMQKLYCVHCINF